MSPLNTRRAPGLIIGLSITLDCRSSLVLEVASMAGRAMSAVDHAWYRMDTAQNLMMVHAIMWTEEPLDWDTLRTDVAQRMLENFPKFRQHPVPSATPLGRAGWQPDADFDLGRHIVQHRLAPPGDRRALQDFISSQIHVRLDPSHPMWQFHCIDGFGSGSAVLFRMHHSISDGITLTRVLLSLTSAEHADFTELPPDRGIIADISGLARGVAGHGFRAVRDPSQLLGAAVTSIRGARRLIHLATIPAKPSSALAGAVGPRKRVTWTDPWPLPEIKALSRSAGVTVNDVLLSILADALGRYLAAAGTPLDSVRVMVPVNLRPLDRPLTSDLGNVFGEYVVTLPTGAMDPATRLASMHRIIEELKESPEAVVAYLTLVAIGWMPEPVEDLSTKLFTGKVVATVSNVPGPRSSVHLCGTPVTGIIGWVPAAGDVGLGVSMFSYNDEVVIGLIADELLIPDLDRLVAFLRASLGDLAAVTGSVR